MDPVECPNCTKDVSGRGVDCPYCGHPMPGLSPKTRSGRRRPLTTSGLVLLGLGAGAWLLLRATEAQSGAPILLAGIGAVLLVAGLVMKK